MPERKTKLVRYVVIGLLLIGISSSVTYLLAPEKIKIETVEIERIVEVRVKQEEVDRKIEREVKPDGTIKETITEKTKSLDKSEATTEKARKTTKEIVRKKKNWMLSGGVLVEPLQLEQPLFYVQVHRRVLGEVYINATAVSDGTVGVGIGFRF